MKKILFLVTVAVTALTSACGETESGVEKYRLDYYPEIKGIKIAEVKAENDFASTSEKVLFYNNPHTTYLLEIADSGEYAVSVNLNAVVHSASAYGQGACLYVSPVISLHTIDSIEVRDSVYVDGNLSDSIYVRDVLYIRDTAYPAGNLYVNRWDSISIFKEMLYAGRVMSVTTLIGASEMADVNAVTISKPAVHAVDNQPISASGKVLVAKRGVAYAVFEIASHIHNAQCYVSNAAGGVGYSVIYIEPMGDQMAAAQALLQN
ncbi:MAG: hypothetical protein LBT94_04860 [Prevotellaceae bacterium]|jgi:hypothetical protein|nr:hypothetical protein [Prevotellaceae bacterium]